MKSEPAEIGVVLAGHGVPATDCPSEWVGQLMALEWGASRSHAPGGVSGAASDSRSHAPGGETPEISARIQELDSKIRNWPRRPGNDPYKEGLEQVAGVLRTLLPAALLEVGYNEFCRPSVPEAIQAVIRKGARRGAGRAFDADSRRPAFREGHPQGDRAGEARKPKRADRVRLAL